MVFKVIFLYIVLGHLLKPYACSYNCTDECMKCFRSGIFSDNCALCIIPCIAVIPSICNKNFSVSINATSSKVEEGDSFTLTCVHNLPDSVTYEWNKDMITVEGEKNQTLIIMKASTQHTGQYICVVHSECGNYKSEPLDVTVNGNSVIILVVCGCAALGLVVIMGIAMKIKLHRDKVKNQHRTKQRLQEMRRAQDLQNRGPLPNPTRILS